ncbi:uncharacterized protein LTR77_004578 [Saxophila tyrrhenica]|uniref:Galactose oxidase n=1 Tax=Saxophila tyrrhenica TaxID=1690608 RepID=A0AAV9PDA4_9PEZI|nr:hypothetical protein LTR77_004578 [Saxophila tyrrhenica]
MRHLQRALGLLALARLLHGQALPYNPTQLSLPTNSSTLYMFRPSSQSPNQAQLLTLDISGSLSSGSLPWKTVSETLPFLQEDEALPYTPTVQEDGSITVTTGNCSEGAEGLLLWRYSNDGGSWTQSEAGINSMSDAVGAQYLASSIAFSELVNSSLETTNVYVFGGMCPTGATSTNAWQGAAEYSNSMLTLSPAGDDASTYQVSTLENRGPPISQAGVSITPLAPTYTLDSSGDPHTQQQDFVLLGGHTQTAFINTSSVAVFSLPQQSWSFMPVEQPSDAKSDLVRRSSAEVTPRSGHTAVLSEDGSSIVLFGGWVGDVNTPATPQLAVLKLGDGYGGSGDWKWTIPSNANQGLSGSAGIYGHGAAMLPGGVMMVVGGYEISTATARRFRRSSSANTSNYFYNVTSNTWLDSYTVPAGQQTQSSSGTGPLSTTSQKVGLGAGLGVGAALLISVVGVYFWYSRRVKSAREDRERALLTHSSDGSSFGQMEQPFLDTGGIDGRGGEGFALGRFWPAQGQQHPRPPPTQHTTGVFVNVPSPTRGLRRGVAAKNYQYQAAPRYDDNRMSHGSGNIHPIAEQENEDEVMSIKSSGEQLDDAEAKLREIERVLHGVEDPFVDPMPNPLGSHPVSPEMGETETVRRVPTGASRLVIPARKPVPGASQAPNWIAEPELEEEGGVSPSRTEDRTSSTLSEMSQRSAVSNDSIQRTMSTRTGAILAAAMASQRRSVVLDGPPIQERTQTMSTDASYRQTRARSSTAGSFTPGMLDMAERDSFTTARTNFAQLQSEGEALLGGRPPLDPDDPYQRAMAAQNPSQPTAQAPSYSRGAPPMASRRRPGLLGSLRRVLNVAERSFSLTGSAEQYRDDPQSTSSSPTKERGGMIGQTPRRAVSDGGALLRQKRGQQDWDEKDWAPYRDNPEDWGEPAPSVDKRQAEEDWDVEGAANKRDFQVMFTVPKARLRVVNDDMDRASLRSASDSAVSRSGSTKELRREESVRIQKGASEGLRLPSTEEEKEEMEKEKAA